MEPLRAQDPRQVGAYRLTARLAEGGQGVVFLGEAEDGVQVAVKFLKAENANDPQFRRRFAREVATAQMVSGAHTAPVVDADPDGNPPWLATAYIPGPSLDEAVGRNGPLDEDSLRCLGAGLAEGLASIHVCGLVHRDLKPANIILADDGPRIIDFGVARTMTETSLTTAGMVIGTVAFMSPEQVGGVRVDTRSDVFSLGSILAYAATGLGPFSAPSMAATAGRIAGGPPHLPGVGGQLREIIAACLAKDPAARPGLDTIAAALQSREPQTDTEYAKRIGVTAPFAALQLAPQGTAASLAAESAPGTRPRGRKAGTGMIAASLIVAAGAGAGLGIVLLTDGGSAPNPAAAHPVSATSAPPSAAGTTAAASKSPTARPATASAPASVSATTPPPPVVPVPAESVPAPRTSAAAPRPRTSVAPSAPVQTPGKTWSTVLPGGRGGYGGYGGRGGHGGHGR